MPLDELLETVVTLRGRIEAHGNALRTSEAQTRYALIDPLLRTLGWDTSDPAQVVPEYTASGGRADYALLGKNGRPAVMVEAKKLDRPLQDGLLQSITYCVAQNAPYFCVTDGRRWALYETFRQVGLDEKLITSFDLLTDSPEQACLKALALWRSGVAEGKVSTATKPVLDTGTPVAPTPQPPTSNAGETWVGLTEVPTERGTPLPREIRLPDGTTCVITSWGSIPIEVTRWLVAQDEIPTSSLPLQAASDSYILATSPVGPTGKRFANPQQFGEIWLAPHGNIYGVLRKSQRIIQHAGLDPADFKVRLAD